MRTGGLADMYVDTVHRCDGKHHATYQGESLCFFRGPADQGWRQADYGNRAVIWPEGACEADIDELADDYSFSTVVLERTADGRSRRHWDFAVHRWRNAADRQAKPRRSGRATVCGQDRVRRRADTDRHERLAPVDDHSGGSAYVRVSGWNANRKVQPNQQLRPENSGSAATEIQRLRSMGKSTKSPCSIEPSLSATLLISMQFPA